MCPNETLRWRHNERGGVSNHRRLDCLITRLFRHRAKKSSISASLAFVRGIHRWPVNFRQGASSAENVSIWWSRHDEKKRFQGWVSKGWEWDCHHAAYLTLFQGLVCFFDDCQYYVICIYVFFQFCVKSIAIDIYSFYCICTLVVLYCCFIYNVEKTFYTICAHLSSLPLNVWLLCSPITE